MGVTRLRVKDDDEVDTPGYKGEGKASEYDEGRKSKLEGLEVVCSLELRETQPCGVLGDPVHVGAIPTALPLGIPPGFRVAHSARHVTLPSVLCAIKKLEYAKNHKVLNCIVTVGF